MQTSHPFFSVLFLLALVAPTGCQSERQRPATTGLECGAEGTHTVLIEGTCYCEAGHVLASGGDRCEPDPVTADAATGADAGAVTADAAIEPDAGPPPEGTLRGVGTSVSTCAEGCAAVGFPCAATCEGTAGRASYGYYDWDYGWYRSVHSEDLASCDATWASSYDHTDGESYELGEVYCCCEIPDVSQVAGVEGETCEQTCAARGFEGCASFHEWPGEDTAGGTLAAYERPSTGSVTYIVMGCDATPPAEDRIAGATRYLRSWECACY